jgi:RNA polymerase II elongation factor ELL
MPLPINTTLSLLGASRPGDALPSKPKKAMLVRMSSEILDAFEASAQPLVQFEFGENPVCSSQPIAINH